MEGEVNKMLVDDKGTVLLCAFGLPPRSHPDDSLRAVRLAPTAPHPLPQKKGGVALPASPILL